LSAKRLTSLFGGSIACASFLPTSIDGFLKLHWEEAAQEDGAASRWLARAPDDAEADAREFFIALDDLSGHLVGVVRPRKSGICEVIAATPLNEAIHLSDSIVAIKDQIADWLNTPHGKTAVGLAQDWQRRRFWLVVRANIPLATGAFFVGGLLGGLVALGTMWIDIAGWPKVIAALLIGASAGLALKRIADSKFKFVASHALTGSWVRFVIVTTTAILGTGLGSVSLLIFLFWKS
jgi:hypothetical protein